MRVKIVNVNEFAPVFRQKTFRFNVDESSKPSKKTEENKENK